MNRLIEQKNSTLLLGLLLVWLLFICMLLLSFYYSLVPNYQSFNIGIFLSIIIYNMLYGIVMFNDKNLPYLLFSPLFWYKFISILFYGIGPLSYYFGNKITIEVMHLYYFTSHETLSKIALIYITVIFLTDLILLVLNHISPLPSQALFKHVNKKLLFFYTLIIGISCKFFIMIPAFYFGVGFPAIVIMFSKFTYVSIFLSYGMGKNNIFYRIVFYILVLSEMGTSLLTLSKEYLYMTILFAAFTVFFYKKNVRTMFVTGLVSAFLYIVLIQNLFILLRSSDEGNFGLTSVTELTEAVDTARILTKDGVSGGVQSYQAWWTRLSYVNYQAYAVEAYEMGSPGKTFENIKYAFIPRVIYPEKPNLNSGKLYNSLIQNTFNERTPNSTGPGFFLEAYWNGGWSYLIATIIYFTFLVFYFSKIIIKNLKQKNYLILMLAVNAIYIGRGIDDWFTGRYVSFILFIVIIYIFSLIFYKSIEAILITKKIELNE